MSGKGKETRATGWRSLAVSLVFAAAFFALFTVALLYASNYARDQSSFRFSRMAIGNIHVDVLVAGGSRGVNLITGRDSANPPSVFNIAYNAQQSPSTLALVKAFFRRGNTARIVMIDASVFYTHDPNCEDKVYWSLYPDLYEAQRNACSSDVMAARFFPLTAFSSEIFLRDLYYLFAKRNGDQDWANEVTLTRSNSIAPLNRPARRAPVIRAAEAHAKALYAGEDLLDFADALGSDCKLFADEVHLSPNGRKALLPTILKAIQARLAP